MVMAIIKVATVTRITTTITVMKITITITPRILWGVVAPNQCRWVPVSILSYCSIELSLHGVASHSIQCLDVEACLVGQN